MSGHRFLTQTDPDPSPPEPIMQRTKQSIRMLEMIQNQLSEPPMTNQEYINQELSRHLNHVERLRNLPRSERLENMADLSECMQDVDRYIDQCEHVMSGNFGFAAKHLFCRAIDDSPRMNHVAYLGQLVAVCGYQVKPVDARKVYNKLTVSQRETLNARIRQAIDDAKAAR